MQGPATDVFLSYKAEDRARLKPLVQALEAEGFSVWWDTHIGGGTYWREDIQHHLDAAKCVVVAWSKRSIGREGDFVRDEASRAQHRDAYIPVCIDAVTPPLGFGEVQAISLKGWKGDTKDPRFRAIAAAVGTHVTGEHVAHLHGAANALFHKPQLSRRAMVLGGSGVAAVAIAGVGAWKLLKASAGAASGSIAVLPFANLSGDPGQSYFADGVADEIRGELARIGGFTVIGSTSSEAVRNDDARTAAKKLGVANILTGNVRQSPSTIRVTAELIDGRTGADRWTQDYDRSPGDTIKIQTDIAENVAAALKGALGLAARSAIRLGGTADPQAQDLILQSRKPYRETTDAESLRRSLALADAAIARDPHYADAYVEKANALYGLVINYAPTAVQAADQLAKADARRKKPSPSPRSSGWHIRRWLSLRRAVSISGPCCGRRKYHSRCPQTTRMFWQTGRLFSLYWRVRRKACVSLTGGGIALDPLNARVHRFKSEALVEARRYPQAIEAGRKALEFAPELRFVHIYLGDALLLLGQADKAKAEYQAIGTGDPFQMGRLALLAARIGDRAGAELALAQLKRQFPTGSRGYGSYGYGEIEAQLGDKDRAFAELDDAIAAKNGGLVYLKVDPFLDPLRGDPRYERLLKRLNFP